jgi:hypothetical protein
MENPFCFFIFCLVALLFSKSYATPMRSSCKGLILIKPNQMFIHKRLKYLKIII